MQVATGDSEQEFIPMIDTHCHLYSKEFEHDIHAVIERGQQSGVNKFYLPAIDSSTHDDMMLLEKTYAGVCYSMIGLHPCSVKEDYENEMTVITSLLQHRKFSGIGETGLDFYWDTSFKTQQYLALEQQIRLALEYDLPLILHTRNAMQETIDVIKGYKGRGLRGIFHCFGGTVAEAMQIIECDFLMGIGGVVTYKNAGLDKVLPGIDVKHLVLETDAPYLSPVPHRGKRNESSYLGIVAEKIAQIKNLSLAEVIAATTFNAEKLFNATPVTT